ncbi:ABC transporter permease [Desulfuromonas versatilis]|uniref:ABC transporter permease n=1 Tax=Desulfuromonas versatilis TaxID=2802975 RepID=A0ABM8HV86_9BACT|nr:FtsX-like permease family protein [Desulfuromonas versatilis]BCR04435.1 ABC transporter permease [Desulfuromonas versatilis]
MMWLARQRYLLDFTLSSLLRRKGKNAALVLVYTAVVFALASVMLFTQALLREAQVVLRDAPEIVVQRLAAGRHDPIPIDYAEQIAAIPGVTAVRPKLWGYYFDTVFQANYTLLVDDEFPHGPGNIAIGPGIAKISESEIDNILPFWTDKGELVSFNISEILSAESELVSSDLILLTEEDFRMLFGFPQGAATDLEVRVLNPNEIPVVAGKIRKLLPDTRPIVREEILRTYDAVFSWRSGLLVAILGGALLAFVIFAWDKASGLSAEEKKEIGVLKAIGWETSEVLQMKFWEGTVISLSSFLVGMLLAYWHVFLTDSALFAPVLKGWAILYPQFRLVPFIDPFQVATLFFLTVLPYTVATIIPAWRAATIDPDAVLRS